MTLTAIIVDDEPLARERIRTFLGEEPDFAVAAECAHGEEALAAIAEHRPDLVFLDVQMPGMDGLEVVRALPAEYTPLVVFTTAHDQFALEAFEVNAVDYLLKPFKLARFKQAVARARQRVESRSAPEENRRLVAWLEQHRPAAPGRRRLLVRAGEKVAVVKLDDIDWVEAAGNYAILHVGKTNHILRETMGKLETDLPEGLFFRASRSAIINLQRVRELQALPGGQHVVLLQDGQKVTMTRPLRELQQRLDGL